MIGMGRLFVGIAVSVGSGVFLLPPLMDYMLRRLGQNPDDPKRKRWLSTLLGCVERALYTLALAFSAGELAVVWLAIKAAAQWEHSKNTPGAAEFDNAFLVGTGVSLLLGILGAAIALGGVPLPPALQATPK